ncbi:MAG: ATP phosphoribosyltransferase regulatory subunit, partial [Oligoflexus sp.]|nr:ATP phosphoribosyltransferase regulatory subunit [Oligoflexus sp.]
PKSFTMSVGHRIILSALIRASLPTIDPSLEFKVLIILDKLAKIGRPAVRDLLLAMPGVEADQPDQLLARLEQKNADGDTDLEGLKSILESQPEAIAEIARLQVTAQLIRTLVGESRGKLVVDLSIARGLGYYTGIVFETTIDGLDGFGSISSGGRYNGLVSRFSNTELAGIGGSIGVDRLLAVMEQLSETKASERQGVFIALAGSEGRAYGFELLKDLRDRSIVSDIALKEGKLGNQFKLADKRNFAWVLTIGSEELQGQTVSLKHLASGAEHRGIPKAQGFELLKSQ